MDILRFTTAGNVDDGKSTLIGRLLHDTQNIKSDILNTITHEKQNLNLAYITDGLRSEREQGITIDVAYKYFTTKNRKYIITDAPGHFQYTKNLVTGASNVDLIIILVDAVNGITEQTRRHTLVASFLKIKRVIVAVNKMDVFGYDEEVFNAIRNEYMAMTKYLVLPELEFIPISALQGDNICAESTKMNWYTGCSLLQLLEGSDVSVQPNNAMAVVIQNVFAQQGLYTGKVVSGYIRKHDAVVLMPGGKQVCIEKLLSGFKEISEAVSGQNVCLGLQPGDWAQRGTVLLQAANSISCSNLITAEVCWLDADHPLLVGKNYLLRIGAAESPCSIAKIEYKIDVNTYDKVPAENIHVNEFAKVNIITAEPIAFGANIPELSRGILIDPVSNFTSGALMIRDTNYDCLWYSLH